MYLDGQHLTHGRFFPLEYIKAVLALGERVDVTMDTPVEALIERFRDRVDYDSMHASCYARVETGQQLLANWQVRPTHGPRGRRARRRRRRARTLVPIEPSCPPTGARPRTGWRL